MQTNNNHNQEIDILQVISDSPSYLVLTVVTTVVLLMKTLFLFA